MQCNVTSQENQLLRPAVHLHIKDKGHTFQDGNANVLAREDGLYERGVKENPFTSTWRNHRSTEEVD